MFFTVSTDSNFQHKVIKRQFSPREKCSSSELFWSECGKTQTRITPNMDTFTQCFFWDKSSWVAWTWIKKRGVKLKFRNRAQWQRVSSHREIHSLIDFTDYPWYFFGVASKTSFKCLKTKNVFEMVLMNQYSLNMKQTFFITEISYWLH